MSALSRPVQWVKAHPYSISILIVVVLVGFIISINRAQDRREQREDAYERVDLAEHDARIECLNANESRALIRAIGVELALANAEALIAVAEDADKALIEAFRERTRANAEETVSQLTDRECEAEAQEARQEAAKIEDVNP